MESSGNLTGLAVVALAALLCGLALARLHQPAFVGYILAGILLGPSALGLVDNRDRVAGLAELGVLMLLFLVGMQLNVRAFRLVWRLALTAVALQVAASVAVMLAVAFAFDFPPRLSILLGFVVALSSTAVAIRMMEQSGELKSRVGRLTVAVLIAQDLAFVPMLLTVESFDRIGLGTVLHLAAALALLAFLMWLLRRPVRLPFAHIVAGDADLSPLTGLVYCFGAAALAGLIDLSPAYGAFVAGLVIGNSNQRERMIQASHPIQSILMMAFFLSIGLLIDLRYVADNALTVFVLFLIVTVFKTALNVAIMRILGENWTRAFLEGVLISQIGEFSFLLAAAGLAAGTISPDDSRLVVSVTALSLALSPVWLVMARRVHNIAQRRPTTLGEVLDIAYGSEQEIVTEVYRALRQRVGGLLSPPARQTAPAADPPGDPAEKRPGDGAPGA
jgi:CPA2 family monovalent cation:H+ antiporter-2